MTPGVFPERILDPPDDDAWDDDDVDVWSTHPPFCTCDECQPPKEETP